MISIAPVIKQRHARVPLSGIQAAWIPAFAGMTISIFSRLSNKSNFSVDSFRGATYFMTVLVMI